MILKYKRETPSVPLLQVPMEGNAGIDLCAAKPYILYPWEWVEIETGVAFEIPDGYEGEIRGRSGLAFNHNVVSFNGTIDANYRGFIKLLLCYQPTPEKRKRFPSVAILGGDRVSQIIIKPVAAVALREVELLTESNRGTDGFGSSGVR